MMVVPLVIDSDCSLQNNAFCRKLQCNIHIVVVVWNDYAKLYSFLEYLGQIKRFSSILNPLLNATAVVDLWKHHNHAGAGF